MATDALRRLIRTSKGKTKQSLQWFDKLIKGKLPAKQDHHAIIGMLHSFVYDAKHKDKLPVWDAFPLSIPIDYYDDGWLGLNIHYLPLRQRVELLQALDKVSRITNKTRRYAISYNILKGVAGSDLYAPTIHRYLTGHIRTKYTIIDLREDYSNVIHLPAAKWRGPRPY